MTTKTHVACLLVDAAQAGIEVAYKGGRFKVRGPEAVLSEWAPRLRERKEEIEVFMRKTGCMTCEHVCDSGCCGAPVAAGLSDAEGVIAYGNAYACPAFEARSRDYLLELVRRAKGVKA